jgi:hypothetical protein
MTFTEIITIVGGWSVIVGGLSAWAGKLLSERATLNWKQAHQKEIEDLKDQIARERLVIDTAIGSFSFGQQKAQEKRLQAIESLWHSVLEVRRACQPAIIFYSILLPSEYNDLFTNPKLQKSFSQLNYESTLGTISASDDLEKQRPYLGETLWYLFYLYKAILGRMTHLLVEGKEKGAISGWGTDNLTKQYLERILTEDQLKQVINNQPDATEKIVSYLESYILEEISLIVSGERSSKESFDYAKKLKSDNNPEQIIVNRKRMGADIKLIKFQ